VFYIVQNYTINGIHFKKHSDNLFNTYHKKFLWLLKKRECDVISKIKEIKYQVQVKKDKKELGYRLINNEDWNYKDDKVINVISDPKKFDIKNLEIKKVL